MTRRSLSSLAKKQSQGKSLNKKALASSHADLNLKFNLLARQFKTFSDSIGPIWANQKELGKSANLLDEQFVVLTRLAIGTLNKLLLNFNKALLCDENLKPEKIDLISYGEVNRMFDDWNSFKARPDFREHMRTWMMGDDLSTLPPVPVKEEVKETTNEKDETNAPESDPGNASAGSQPSESSGVTTDPPAALSTL